ncbi:hypothetical protein [Tropicimonas sp. S265A]|uniref:hypothetical protein n=1 Tax=Tropicimonas sp. S265A TaxID=3415134 RepID=UPI003C7AB504
MKRFFAATTALVIASSSIALANSPQLINDVQATLNEYGVPVDASTLSAAQLTEVHSLDLNETTNIPEQLATIVNYEGQVPADANTLAEDAAAVAAAAESAADTTVDAATDAAEAVADAIPESGTDELVAAKLGEYNIEVDTSELTDAQKVEILSVDVSDLSAGRPEERLRAIIDG